MLCSGHGAAIAFYFRLAVLSLFVERFAVVLKFLTFIGCAGRCVRRGTPASARKV